MNSTKKIYPLKGKVQHYAWGGYEFIPALLQLENAGHKPFAEYWMGAHPGAPSTIVEGNEQVPLTQKIAQEPTRFLGETVYQEFGELPYLFKVLDVKDMPSIQVHPTKAEAEKGFDAEESAGVPIDAADRNYKDRNHKPEVMVALSPFWLLHGFKPIEALEQLLISVPEFNFLLPEFDSGNYYQLYKTVMEMPQQQVDAILLPLAQRAIAGNDPAATVPEYWVKKLFAKHAPADNLDRGIFSIYFFNIVELKTGQAIFQGAGIPHAYLFGQNIELMANSDNVLRGGLTPKHIDVPELLKHTLFTAVHPHILSGAADASGELNYSCPVRDFGISAIILKAGDVYQASSHSAEIFIIVEGAIAVREGDLQFKKGDSFVVVAGTTYSLEGVAAATVFKAFVPL